MTKIKRVKTRVFALLSGGLDSILAIKILQKQGIEITGLSFVSYFFNVDSAKKAAEQLKIELREIDFSDEHFEMIKNPKYGYGKAMNPCIDCHILMLRKAKKLMDKEAGVYLNQFVCTGEVLGQRPMSQNKQSLDLIEKESGLKGYLLRPLSAKFLEPTILEKKGLVDRNKLFDISGRSRKEQMALAKKWGIKEYPSPAGGCILTDFQFGVRLKELLQKWPDAQSNDIKLLRFGRHFWVENEKIIVGRNKQENGQIKKLSKKGDTIIEPKEFPGPTILIKSRENISEKSLIKAKELMIKYSPKMKNKIK
ncbi:MAG: tRNA 4-thiouridine(8) synthase ThiI [bacterium]